MDIRTYEIKDPLDIHKFFRVYQPQPPIGWWFRGHADKTWDLIPKAGRPTYYLPQTDATSNLPRDLGRFNTWRERIIAYIHQLPENDWECLALAQHHGLATRLLDWTFNPLVGVFFACSESMNVDGCVYCYDPDSFVKKNSLPLDVDVVGIGYVPRALSSRILNQRGAFTLHGPPTSGLVPKPHKYVKDTDTLVRLDIPASLKWDLLNHLDRYGINRATLFPDADGLSAHVNFETQEILKMHKEYRT